MRISLSLLCLVANLFIGAQTINISVSEVKNFDPYFDANAQKIYRLAVDKIAANKRFTLVERKFFDAIEKEKERQKNEGFIDGVIVKQGVQQGANLLFNIAFDRNTQILATSFINIEEGITICSHSYDFNQFPDVYTLSVEFENVFSENLAECLGHLLPTVSIEMVEILTAKGPKATKLLFYCEGDCGILKNDQLIVYYHIEKQLANKKVDFEEVIGKVKVTEIENDDFFNAEVLEGDKKIFEVVQEKKTLYAKFK